MSLAFENRNYAIAGAFLDELARCGLRHVCLCPGSRSTPLAICAGRHPGLRTWVHLDERSAGFFGLGIARVTGQPVALISTSGTAAANFHPAVVEARYGGVPLVVLTADRPPELVDWGALQTIDQVRLYGAHVKWSVSMPPPEATRALVASARAVACRAFATALEWPAGPVHINFPFREPLEPEVVLADRLASVEDADETWHGRATGEPFLKAPPAERRPSPTEVERLAAGLVGRRGIIVCGPQPDPRLAPAVAALADRLGYPILADPLSQVRAGPHDRRLVVDCYDAFLRDSQVVSSLAPEVVLRLGAVPTSKPLTQYLERHQGARHLLVQGEGAWRDPFLLTSEAVSGDAAAVCIALAAAATGEPQATWFPRWLEIARATEKAIEGSLEGMAEMFEGKLCAELAGLLPDGMVLFAGNSMPVRDLDTFFPASARRVRFLANRGASGIDGVLSTALGAAAAAGGRVVLVVGDISFYHDMNGLLAARAHGLDATIIVVNNDGGGIFSFLPQAAYPDVFEPYFGTPHGLTFGAAAELYGLRYEQVGAWPRFREAVSESLATPGTTVIEVPGDRALNVELHRRVWQAVALGLRATEVPGSRFLVGGGADGQGSESRVGG